MPCAQAAALKACEAQEKLERTTSGVKAKPKTKQSKAGYDAECILAETEDKYKVKWQGYEPEWEVYRTEGEVGTPIVTWEPKANLEATIALKAWKARPKEVKKREGTHSALAEAKAASEASQALLQTPGPTTAALKATQARAEGAAGQIAKWTSNMQKLLNRWQRYLLVHGEEYDHAPDSLAEPSLELCKGFVTYSFKTRKNASQDGKQGLGENADLEQRCALLRKGHAGSACADSHMFAHAGTHSASTCSHTWATTAGSG